MRNRHNTLAISDWTPLTEMSQLDTIAEESNNLPVVIFKHSTTCGISAMAKHRLESSWNLDTEEVKFYYLDLLTYRPISNEIANRFNVFHQSPQIIVMRNGEATFTNSHSAISTRSLGNAVSNAN